MFDQIILGLTIFVIGAVCGAYGMLRSDYLADLDEGYRHGMEAANTTIAGVSAE